MTVPRGSLALRAGCWTAGFLLSGLLPSAATAQSDAAQTTAFDQAIAAAEGSLQQRDFPAAERHYREALFEGWLLMVTLERLEGRLPEAQEALRNVSRFAIDSGRALRARAVAHLQTGDPAPAVEILTGLAGKDPKDAETHRLLAKALAAGGYLEQAAREMDAAGAAINDDPELAFVVATEQLWMRNVDGAERLFAQVVKARPLPQTHVLIGRAYRDAGEYARARAELQAALLQDPTVRRAHYYLGMVLLAEGGTDPARLKKARPEFEEELKIAPLDPATNDQLGLVLLESGRSVEALSALDTAVRGEARAAYLYDLGRCQLALDRAADATESTKRALALAHEQGAGEDELERIHYQFGRALRMLGQEQEAAAHLAEAGRLAARRKEASGKKATPSEAAAAALLDASPLSGLTPPQRLELKGRVAHGLVQACFNLGVLQAQNMSITPPPERYARAAEFFAQAADLDPAFPQVQSSLGVARFNARQFEQATGPLSRALAANPQDASLKRMLAMSWLDIHEWEKAAALLKDDPGLQTEASVQFAYGLALVRSRRGAEAEAVLSGLVSRQGDSADLSVLIGQAQFEQGKLDAAVESLQRAQRLQADVAEANATLGAVYLKKGRLKEAEDALRVELASRPTDVQSHLTLAAVLDAGKQSDAAVALLRDVVRTTPDSAEARALLGGLLLKQGATTDAADELEAAARLAPGDAKIHNLLGSAYQKLGRTEQARQQLETARRLEAERRETRQ
jgi:tetratricopeptide (TPR) repeat protein